MLPWHSEHSLSPGAGLREASLAKMVRDEVLSLILRGELPPGERINEPDIAARLSVSRVPVREALRELEASGLVAARMHSGVFVRVLAPSEVRDLYELRAVLDRLAGHKSALLPQAKRRALAKWLNRLTKEMVKNARDHDVQTYYANNLKFHWAIVESAGNEHVARTYRTLVQQLHLSRLENLSRDVGMHASMDEHEDIATALAVGDADRCAAVSESHVTQSYERLRARLNDDPHKK